ncbi:helix-turn-helix transcriptional regulator [Streptomyces sp. NPDC046866]|uniref:helix-turn-helix transcriptional regulator n=1 Tax=Streptomyces sp. NPDC046866 TaxID=3154921 RepID=UPI003452ADB6
MTDSAAVRTTYTTRDPEAAREHLEAACGAAVRMEVRLAAGAYEVTRIDAGPFALTELCLPGRLSTAFSPAGLLTVGCLRSGCAELRSGDRSERLGAGDVCLEGRPEEARTLVSEDLRISSVLLPADLVERAADDLSPRRSRPVQFTGLLPAGPRMAALWQRTADFARGAVLTPGGLCPPVAGETARLLAATALAVFPTDLDIGPPSADLRDAGPETLRRAKAFIEANAQHDITLAHVAAAAYVTPRAVQYAFRRHMDTTPLHYARRVRLDHAHTELQDADPGAGATVTDIAARWGFTHAGRFAAAYRRAYGEPPRTTLRR